MTLADADLREPVETLILACDIRNVRQYISCGGTSNAKVKTLILGPTCRNCVQIFTLKLYIAICKTGLYRLDDRFDAQRLQCKLAQKDNSSDVESFLKKSGRL
jgi:hypothetical protein